jgi:AcrR family transcriptional regulator
MIVDAVIPLLLEHGRDLTSKQIAEAAGIAEGTIYRAFGDKESLVNAAVEKYLDPEPLRDDLRAIDPTLALDAKLRAIVEIMLERFTGVIRMMTVYGRERPHTHDERNDFAVIVADILADDADRLAVRPERVGHFIRLIAFASSIPQFTQDMDFTIDELTQLITTGVTGQTITTASKD